MEAKLTEVEWVQSRYDKLNLIEEKRLIAMCHGQLYQQRMKKAFDRKVKPRVFREEFSYASYLLSVQQQIPGRGYVASPAETLPNLSLMMELRGGCVVSLPAECLILSP
ncbi:hypothetical protein KIW84_030468 [Lathyrus oleraceus]|uniref:Uncharacterized protein n=1 Tax=Pisum sativum TaxID=3888 RepID=A0A9D4XSG3_PEA|nr:hypothetical protein KIW84_030468 [Pisum sativum]